MEKMLSFYSEVKKELTNVSWPKKDEIVGSTMIVLFVTIVLSIFLLFVDKILEKLVFIIL